MLENFYLVAGMQAVAMKPWLIAQIFADMKFSNPSIVVQEQSYIVEVCTMARNITVELLSGKVCTLAVQPEMTIEELKEEVKAFHPSEDELTRRLSTVELVVDGEQLNDLQMTVSESILDAAKVQVVFYVKPALECASGSGCKVQEVRDVRIPNTETRIRPSAFAGCRCLLRLVIPESVTAIGDRAFRDCSSLTSLTIPASVTHIDTYAFAFCRSLTSLTIPESVIKIEEFAFRDCKSLTSLTIPGSVTQIGNHAFADCTSLTSLTIPQSVTQIGDHAFARCSSLTSLTIPESVTRIAGGAFSQCTSLTSLTIPGSVTQIAHYAFADCFLLRSLTIPESVTHIGNFAFSHCRSLTSLTIPESVTRIAEGAFRDCSSLTSLTIPASVTRIGDHAFANWRSLTSLTIPESVTHIGTRTFDYPGVCAEDREEHRGWLQLFDKLDASKFCSGCQAVEATPQILKCCGWDGEELHITLATEVYTLAVPPEITIEELKEEVKAFHPSEDELTRRLSTVELVVDGEKLNDLKVTVSESILDSAKVQVVFYVKPALEWVNAFGCNVQEVRDVRIPNTQIRIRPSAFSGCHCLLRLVIPESVTAIGDSAFRDCSSLQSLVIPESVIQIGNHAFRDCTSLTSLTIPKCLTRTGHYAFAGCSSLTSLTMPESVTQIQDCAFRDCSSLTSLSIPESATRIGNHAFALTIPGSVRKIGKNIVDGCSSLTNWTHPNSVRGVYILRFYKHGQWHQVVIDDAIPFDSAMNPLTARTEFWPSLPWPALVEKAYAKLHGSWEGLSGGGHVEEVMTDLTGGCSTRFGTADVAQDRLWQYMYFLQDMCLFGCNINDKECAKRRIPMEQHYASAIFRLAKHEGVPYVCVCMSAPLIAVARMPSCRVPMAEGYGVTEGFVWLRIDDFVQLFDTVYECRLVNSISFGNLSPGWIPGEAFFEEIYAFQGDVYTETSPSFLMEILDTPNELVLEVTQTDLRYGDAHDTPELARAMQAPLLLRFFQCSKDVSDAGGGEVYMVHMSAWGHTRDASLSVKVMRPGKYLAMVSIPAKYTCHRMIFRCYSTRPLVMKPITQHRSWISVNPSMPLNAIPYSLCGFQRVDALSEKLPQMFDEAEGRGKPMANAQLDLSGFGIGPGPGLPGLPGMPNLQLPGMPNLHLPGMPNVHLPNLPNIGKIPNPLTGLEDLSLDLQGYSYTAQMNNPGRLKAVGQFGGQGAVASVSAAEVQDGNCCIT
eukprot:s106_g27.t2